jgi:hypothetical protein
MKIFSWMGVARVRVFLGGYVPTVASEFVESMGENCCLMNIITRVLGPHSESGSRG